MSRRQNSSLSLCCLLLIASAVSVALGQQPQRSVSGIVSDSYSKEILVGAFIALYHGPEAAGDPYLTTSTNKYGFFSFARVPVGSITVVVRHLGYHTTVIPTYIRQSSAPVRLDVELLQEAIPLSEITVEARPDPVNTLLPGTNQIAPEVLQRIPSLGGEPDIIRSLQLLPGVKMISELSSGLYVRGSPPDENLTLLDGFMVYDPSHLGGFLGIFNADAVKDIRLVKGGFPAEYGQRISSVLDVTMRDGARETHTGVIGLATLNGRLLLEGPIADNAGYLFSARIMYWDLLAPVISPDNVNDDYGFYDLYGKVSFQASPSDRFYASGFYSDDLLRQPPYSGEVWFDIGWRNGLASGRWTHIFSPTVFVNTAIGYTHYDFTANVIKGGEAISFSDFATESNINDFRLKSDVQWFTGEDNTIKGGMELVFHDFVTFASEGGINQESSGQDEFTQRSTEITAFLQDEWRPLQQLAVNIGARFAWFSSGDYFRAEPRAAATWSFSDGLLLKTSVTVAHQFIHLVSRNDISLPNGVWFPSTESLRPSRSIQTSAGFEASFLGNDVLLTLDGYYKDLKDIYEYRDGADFVSGAPLEEQFVGGIGWAYGMEVLLNKRTGHLTGWIAYTLSWSRRKFADLNGGRPFYPSYDRRHDLAILLGYRLAESWELTASWVYGSGQAYSTPTGAYLGPPLPDGTSSTISIDYAERNAYRLPPFHRLDLGLLYRFDLLNLDWTLSMNLYNAYDRDNVYAHYVSFDEGPGGSYTPVFNQVSLFGITPSIGISARF